MTYLFSTCRKGPYCIFNLSVTSYPDSKSSTQIWSKTDKFLFLILHYLLLVQSILQFCNANALMLICHQQCHSETCCLIVSPKILIYLTLTDVLYQNAQALLYKSIELDKIMPPHLSNVLTKICQTTLVKNLIM